ncbi:hypothetical protein KSP39_PZI012786 [Platanthera zijinensis]|uniref:tRNA (adenine(58)-N(1))-methyltransferase non-catalytic subunit TRM6 n=1 Tax=Platanthera zijinensis TaxID=2320716 RepID=A0AAP0BGF2_9ASPA
MFNFSTEVNSRIVQASFTDLSLVQENDFISSHQEILKTWNDSKSTSFSAESIPPKSSMPVVENDAFQEVNIPFNTSFVSHEILELEQSSLESRHHRNVYSHPPVEDSEEGSSVLPAAEKMSIPGKQASPELMNFWKEIGFSSLIVAAPELEVESLVLKFLPLLSYSAPFAIYSQCLQPLAMCMHKLQASKMAINLQISEPWLREYQVLPSRTHPHMQMSAFGGYILSGIRIGSDACNVSNGS